MYLLVISIWAASNSTEVLGFMLKINLFLRVTCVISQNSDMKAQLTHKFIRYPPALFDNSVM